MKADYKRLALQMFALWLVVRIVQVLALGWGHPLAPDILVFERYGQQWAAGLVPYLDFHPEYPPAAMLLFLPPYVLGGAGARYEAAFGLQMMLFDLAIIATLLAWWLRLRNPPDQRTAWLAFATYMAFTVIMAPVLYSRFDLAVTAAMFASLYLAYRDRWILSGFLFAVAIWLKLWPVVLAPACLALAFRRGGMRSVLLALAGLVLASVVCLLPVLPRAGMGVFGFLGYHAARGMQLDSTWANVVLVLHELKLVVARKALSYGSWNIAPDVAPVLLRLSTPALLLAVLVPQLLAMRSIGGPRDADGRIGALMAATAICGFLVTGKVFSQQYLFWLLPFLLVAFRRLPQYLLLLAIGVLTLMEFLHYGALMNFDPRAIALLSLRNLLVIGVFAYLLRDLWKTHQAG